MERGWGWMRGAARAGLVLAVLGMFLSVSGTSADSRAAVALVLGAILALRALAMYGVTVRGTWGAVLGALFAFGDVVSPLAASALRTPAGDLKFQDSPATLALDWAGAALGVVFLVGLGMWVRGGRRQK